MNVEYMFDKLYGALQSIFKALQHQNAIKGWSQTGILIAGQLSQKKVHLAANFPEEDTYVVQITVNTPTPVGLQLNIDLEWSVENTTFRHHTIGQAGSFQGSGKGIKVNVTDGTIVPAPGTTVSLTNGSNVITFADPVTFPNGTYIDLPGGIYQLQGSISSSTAGVLTNPYLGPTAPDVDFSVGYAYTVTVVVTRGHRPDVQQPPQMYVGYFSGEGGPLDIDIPIPQGQGIISTLIGNDSTTLPVTVTFYQSDETTIVGKYVVLAGMNQYFTIPPNSYTMNLGSTGVVNTTVTWGTDG